MPRIRDETINYLDEHNTFFSEKEEKIEITSLKKGTVISFNYDGAAKYVFVVHPMWKNNVHGLDLKQISRKEFLIVANASPDLSSMELYESFIKGKSQVYGFDAYRSYKPEKMTDIKAIMYDSSLQETEEKFVGDIKAESLIDEAPLVQEDSEKTKIRKMLQDELSRLRQKELEDLL